jgi:hypothetical protein
MSKVPVALALFILDPFQNPALWPPEFPHGAGLAMNFETIGEE